MKERRMGTITFGCLLVALGIIIFASMLFDIELLRVALYSWPVILIAFGAEILYFSSKNDVIIRYDIAGLILSGIILFISFIAGIGCFTFNTLFDDEIIDLISGKMRDEIKSELEEAEIEVNTENEMYTE